MIAEKKTTKPATPRNLAPTLIRASAGSGKTYQLSNRYLALLQQGIAPERILAVTFTRKAAGEIFDRIVLRLAQAADSEARCAELAAAIESPQLSREECRELLVRVTRSLHRLRIGTLDSFFNKIAGACSMELGLPLGWRIVEEMVDLRLRDEAIAASLADSSQRPIRTLLNLLAKGDAVRSISQMVRDTVEHSYAVVRDTAPEVWNKLPKQKGLTQREGEDYRERLEAIKIDHKSIMREIDKDIRYLDEFDLLSFVQHGICKKLLEGSTNYFGRELDAETIEVYEAFLRHARCKLVNAVADQNQATYELLSHFGEHYQRLQQAEGALRFDDLTYLLSRTQTSDDERTNFRLDASIEHLLLDEFQDTSLAQWRVLRPIAQRVAATRGNTFFCVGDTKQAIYGWRGGLSELFDAVVEELPGVQQVPLDTSYRSSPAVIEVVNRVFSQLERHSNMEKYAPALLQWQQQFNLHSTSRTELAGYVTLQTSPRFEGGDEVEEGEDSDRETASDAFFNFAAAQIAAAYANYPGMTIGVLTRTNAAVGKLIYRLRALGVPASEEGGNPLLDSSAVELILALMRLADHPTDLAAAYHLARSPLATHFNLTLENYRRTALLAERLRAELVSDGYGRTIYRWAQLLAPACDSRDRSRLQQLVELAYAWQPQSTLRPGDFLSLVEQQKVSDPTAATVRVMNVHQAKGLEFDIVFLPELDSRSTLLSQTPALVTSRAGLGGEIDCACRYVNESVQQLMPESFQKMFRDHIDQQIGESLCVLYVAMTRAIHALHLIVQAPKENESKLPKTAAALLRATLCSGNASEVGFIFQHGEADWYEREMKRRNPDAKQQGPISPPEPLKRVPSPKIVLAPPPEERRRGLDRESPSNLEGGNRWRIRRALSLTDPHRELAMQRGTVVHAWFEQIHWLDNPLPNDGALLAGLNTIRGLESLSESVRRGWLKDFHAMLGLGDTAAVLTKASYLRMLTQLVHCSGEGCSLEVHNEWPFVVIDGQQILNGRMDRVVFLVQNGRRIAADVLDFKTDATSTAKGERLEDRVEHYRPQLEAYRRTIALQTGLTPERVCSGLLFVGKGKLVRG